MKTTGTSTIALTARPKLRLRTIASILSFGVLFSFLVASAFYTTSSASSDHKLSGAPQSANLVVGNKGRTALAGANSEYFKAHWSSPLLLPVLAPDSVATYEVVSGACTATLKDSFALGEQVCVKASGPLGESRLSVSGTDGTVADIVDIMTDPQELIFTLPSSTTSVVNDNIVDNRGSWRATVHDNADFRSRTTAFFSVTDPANAAADLIISSNSTATDTVAPGTTTGFSIYLLNDGPDPAVGVHVTQSVPSNMTFASATAGSGEAFTCTESGGIVDCVPAGNLAKGATSRFTLNYSVSAGAPNAILTTEVDITSTTADPRAASNASTSIVEIRDPGVPPPSCAVTCPLNRTVAANTTQAGQDGAFVDFSGDIESSGDCGAITSSPASGSFFAVGVHNVMVSSATGGGSCSFTITVTLDPAPTIVCAADQTAATSGCTNEASVTINTPTATGNNVQVTGVRNDNRLLSDGYPVGTTTITWHATECNNSPDCDDPNARSASCTQHIVVTSPDAPTISCPSNKTFPAADCAGKTLTTGDIGTPSAAGSNVTITSRRSDDLDLTGNPYPVGTTTITWSATDDCGRVVSCTQTITITSSGADNVPPTLNVPADVSVTVNSCSALIDDELGVATATDNCGTASITRTGVPRVPCPIPGDPGRTCESFVFPVGTTNVTYTATDAAGNVSTGVQHVTVHETTPPTFTFVPASLTINTGPGATSCGAFVGDATLGTATVADNCDTTVIRSGVPAGNNFPVGVTVITYTAKADTSVTATQTVTIVDNTTPVITAPAPVTLFTGPGAVTCGVTVSNLNATLGTASASDNCPGLGAVSRSGVPAGNAFPVGQTTLTYSVTDAHGNTSTANQTVAVVDNTPPQITCQADIIADYNPAVNGAVVTYTAPVGTDNCASTTTRIAGLASGSTFPVGTTTNTFRVTDASGNTTQCSFKVTVAITSIIGLDSVNISGSGYADSYSSAGGYPATKGSLANILSNGTITIGNSGKVWGNVRSTRANINMSGASQVTGNAIAGTTITTSGSATIGGTRTPNTLGAVMTLPAVPACSPFSSNSGISGTYTYSAATGDLTLSGVNIATLANGNYCFHNITLGNSAQLKVNGPVVIKMTGVLNTSGATNLNNTTQIPSNLRILSSYNGSNGVTLGNSTSVYALVYAPNTGLNLAGAAPLFGTFAGKSLIIGNSGALHYDTQLKTAWPAIFALL
jgi:uncharacterized repeat protein (TIGR01451 family)